jgi:hypothetical protein
VAKAPNQPGTDTTPQSLGQKSYVSGADTTPQSLAESIPTIKSDESDDSNESSQE